MGLQTALAAAERMIAECEIGDKNKSVQGDGLAALSSLRAKGQALKIMMLKDLAIASAMSYKLDLATEHMIAALLEGPEDPAALTKEAAEQVRAAAKGVLELCGRELQRANTQAEAEAATKWSTKIAE